VAMRLPKRGGSGTKPLPLLVECGAIRRKLGVFVLKMAPVGGRGAANFRLVVIWVTQREELPTTRSAV
jgi:hypothetical protein